jgi:hypothetical protein
MYRWEEYYVDYKALQRYVLSPSLSLSASDISVGGVALDSYSTAIYRWERATQERYIRGRSSSGHLLDSYDSILLLSHPMTAATYRWEE